MSNTWKDIEQQFYTDLAAIYPKEEIKQLFLITLEKVATISANRYILVQNEHASDEQTNHLLRVLEELGQNRPLQHILGEGYFYGHIFHVNEHTLIPRPETEELVHLIIQENRSKKGLKIIDIGTGTGCIPISLALAMPANQYTAVDISTEAIQVAKTNAQTLQAEINFVQADILEWELVFDKDLKYDIIVSNPPYITAKEKEQMHSNVLEFEPHSALFVEEEAPLLFYDYIADFAQAHLNPNGTLYFEINQYLSKETKSLLLKKGFTKVDVIQDINGADRMIRAKLD